MTSLIQPHTVHVHIHTLLVVLLIVRYVMTRLQYSRECWCGNQGWDRHGSAADNECQAKCGGNPAQMCGGDNRNSVYEVTKSTFISSPMM